ncbi:MAG TPA: hypothetical protein VD789_05335 [Thermomicrobiales bacterium]|nr:hypothetical protein [Thermomicrobiales bacterium]
MTRRFTRLWAMFAIILALALVPSAIPGAVAQDATQEPQGDAESELAPQLPPVDLPTMNAMGYVFELDSSWEGTAGTPEELPVHEFSPTTYTEEQVTEIAESLGIDGEIESQGEGTFAVAGNGSLFTTPGLLQYVSGEEAPDEEMPDDDAAVAFARDWLRTSGLLPANSDDGAVIATIENPARKIVEFKPASPSPLLSSTPGLTVTVGPGGAVLEARVSWASMNQGDVYRLRPVDDAFNQIATRLSYLDVTLPEDQFPQGSTITGTATYDTVSIAYSTSGVQGEMQFIQPVYVFEGTVTPEGSEESYDIVAYVPAIVTSLQPVG